MARARSDYDLAATLSGGGMWRDTGTSAGAQSGAARVLKGEALADSTGQAGARTVSVHLDQDAEGTSRTFACDCPVSAGDRVTVVLQGGAYKVVSAASMDREQQAQRDEIDEQKRLVEEVTAKVESARQEAQQAQQAAQEAGERADQALSDALEAVGGVEASVDEVRQAAQDASDRAEELAGQVGEVRASVDGVASDVTELTAEVSGAVEAAEGALSKATTVEQSLDEYKVEAESKYLDKATGETLATKAELEAKADEITLAVSEEYATKAELDGISVGGRNLARETSGEWSEWWSPNYGVNNSTTYQARALFPDTIRAGDDVTCQVEMEFDGIEADEAGGFTIYSQGPVDGAWDVTNVWTRLFDLKEPPEDGVYKYVKTLPYPGSSVGRLEHYLGIRCNYVSAGRMRWRCIKVEMGNKPTDWTPAPEDAEERYATKAELTVAEDAITAQVSEVAKTADSAMSKATTVEQTAEGLSAEVSQVSQAADGAVTQLAALSAKVEGISSEVSVAQETADSAVEAASQAQQDITGFKQTVQQTYQTKSDADSAMAQEVLDRNSAIEQSAAQITQTVSETYATIEQVDGISVGGRNLIRGSADGTLDYTAGNGTLQDGGVFGCKAVRTTNAWNGYQVHMLDIANRVGLADGEEVTISIYASTDSDVEVSPTISLFRHNGAGTSQGFGTVPLAPGVWTRLSANFEVTDASALVDTARFESHAATSYGILWSAPKLERGNRVTDWTPAPEDMATTAQVSSAIEQSAEEIALSVSKSYQPKGDYLTNSQAASTYASKSELSVAQDSIASRVEEVASDAEGAYSLASSVRQTAEGLEATVSAVKSEVEGMEVGGRNLLYGTACPVIGSGLPRWASAAGTGTMVVGSATGVPDVGEGRVFAYNNASAAGADYMATVTQAGIPVEGGATYTMSMWVYVNQASSAPMLFTMRCFNGSEQVFRNVSVSTKSKWQRVEWSFEMPWSVVVPGASTTTVRFGCVPTTGQVASVAFGLMKMERGDRATAWCPEPAVETYMGLTTEGLTVGDMTGGELGGNVLIAPDSVSVRKGAATLATFDAEGMKFPGTAVMKKSNTSSYRGLDIINGNGPTNISAYSSADYMANASRINLDGEIYVANGTGASSHFYGNLADVITARGTNSDGEWRKFASGSWEYWLTYRNASLKPNGTTNITLPIPSAIGNKNASYLVLVTPTMQGGSALPDGWSKMAFGVVGQTSTQFTLRAWGDNTFASPNLVMSLNIHVIGRA